MQYSSLVEVLKARKDSVDTGITFIGGGGKEEFLSYQALYQSALGALGYLQQRGVKPKDELVFQLEDNRAFITFFWACILGGIIPVPLTFGHQDDHKQKFFKVWSVLTNPYVVISRSNFNKLGGFAGQSGLDDVYAGMQHRVVDAPDTLSFSGEGEMVESSEDDIAFIQFSSGSTGMPKGVILTHKNLITNVAAISETARYTAADSMLSWMPLTHDMGLIGFHINPLFCGMNQYLFETNLFIRRPALWMAKVNEHRVSILCSPNFGYEYFLKHVELSEEADWDLSCVRIFYNGAEPISRKLCSDFLARLADNGLKSRAMCPVYGLAEASLAVSISGVDDEVMAVSVDRDTLKVGDAVRFFDQKSISFVNVGKAIPNCSIQITDHEGAVVPSRTIGHVEIQGDNVTSGYYNNAQETANVVTAAGWLRTGDLGFVDNGSLYITGRAKEIFFVNGRNYFPHDIERVAAAVEGVELNKIVVVGFVNEQTEKEEVVAFVFHRAGVEKFIPIRRAIERIINLKIGIAVDRVIPVKDIPRTTSGKLQRFKLIEQYNGGAFQEAEAEVNRLIRAAEDETAAVVGPANETEQRLLAIWKRVLQQDAIGVTQRFFEIGGNSLNATVVGMMVLKEFQVELPLEVLYEKQTVRALAEAIGASGKVHYTAIPSRRSDEYYPLSPSQKGIYYFWAVDKLSVAYNIPTALAVGGELDVARLEQCIRQIVERHDSLRMSFVMRSGQPMFSVHDHVDFTLNCIRCSPEEVDETLKTLVQPFDLMTGPLFRVTVVRDGSARDRLFIDFHHVISDGVSLYYFVDELFRLYRGEALAMQTVQYRDFVYWDQAYWGSEKSEADAAYWENALSGELPVLRLPVDFQRPVIVSREGEKIEFRLGKEITGELRRMAQARGCTLHVLLFAVYNVLLSKYSGQDDLVTGIPVAVRRHPDIQQLHGMFVNNLAIRCSVDPEASFSTFLETVRRELAASLAHGEYPFETLLGKIAQKRDVSRHPIFDSMFVFQNMGLPTSAQGEFTLSRYFFDPGFSKFDLSMEVYEDTDSLAYQIEYSTKLFRRDTILDLARHFETLVTRIVNDADSRVADLLLVDDEAYHTYIRSFNATKFAYPEEKTIHQLFDEQAMRSPEKVAVDYKGTHETYGELHRKAGVLAAVLQERGVTRNGIVAILLPRSPGLITAILGVLKAGGCYLLIDEQLPVERIHYLIQKSQCKLVIESNRSGRALTFGSDVASVDVDGLDLISPARREVGQVGAPSDLAYIVYTSGTTGEPKGVMIEHRSLVNYSWWAVENYVRDETVAFPLYTSVSFDLPLTSIFPPLISGNTIVIYDEAQSEVLIEKIVVDNAVDVVKLTPSHLRILAESDVWNRVPQSRIRRFVVGGEQLESRLARQIHTLFRGNVEIFNEYGPTEATVGCMIHTFDPEESAASVPIGIPIGNTQIYLLDKFLNPVPVGVYGELYISGAGIARGYLFDEAITAAKFVPNPFVEGQRMYKTGDVAKRLPNGILEYVGRADQQVKINGYRIELSEIEQHLLAHAGVAEALVTVRTTAYGQRNLYAYYKGNEAVSEAALNAFLANRLPYYMIPVRFVEIDRIPLTRNGKVDFDALPEPTSGSDVAVKVSAKNSVEALSLQIWKAVLGADDVGVSDNFFELGGDSIKAVQIASRLFEQGIAVNVRDILTYHTIEQVSLRATLVDVQVRYEQGVIEGEMRLKPIDQWFVDQKFKTPGYYNQSVLLRFKRKVNVAWLSAAFKRVIQHHDGLRVNYSPERHVLFYNQKHSAETFVVEEFEIEGGDHVQLAAICADVKRGFDVTSSFLLKAAIIRENQASEYVLITAHHLVVDGVSWRILLEDLKTVYEALESGETAALPVKTASLKDWEQRLSAYAGSDAVQMETDYWRDVERTVFTLPQDFELKEWKAEDAVKLSTSLDVLQTAFLLREAHHAYKTDVFILLNTALALTLRAWTGVDRVVIEQESHGRQLDTVDTSRTVGWFTAMYPVVFALRDDSIGEQIKSVKEQIRKIPNRGLGYGVLRDGGKLGSTRGTMAAVRLNYLGQFDEAFNHDLFVFSDRDHGRDTDPDNTMTAKLEMNVMVVGGQLCVDLWFNHKAHAAETIRGFNAAFLKHLEALLAHIRAEEDVHFTPSDFDAVGLDDDELHALFQ